MEIPSKIRRRMAELEDSIEVEIKYNPTFETCSHREFFINSICRNVSLFYVHKYYPEFISDYIKVGEYTTIMLYIFREKLNREWELRNKNF
jgi:predicted transcriptional regulator